MLFKLRLCDSLLNLWTGQRCKLTLRLIAVVNHPC